MPEGYGWLFIFSPPAHIFTNDALRKAYISAEVDDLNHLSENSTTYLHYCLNFFFFPDLSVFRGLPVHGWHFLSLGPDATVLACGIINATWIRK